MRTYKVLYQEIKYAMLDNAFLKEIGMSRKDMELELNKEKWHAMAALIQQSAEADGRFNAPKILPAIRDAVPAMGEEPEEGWLQYCNSYTLSRLFPEVNEAFQPRAQYRTGRLWLLQILHGIYRYEMLHLAFDPTKNMQFLPAAEVTEKGFTPEYLKLRKMSKSLYLYEFMRIGIDITPFNTLGHVAGVHYVAMHAARQLYDAGVPVDLALISGAAAGHDIGKYGCRKHEEKRIPYLHYYYTDLCFNRFDMPVIGHIAANHSTWDLELENLSVESLLLIYADFRVKSSRTQNGAEIVHFYSLADAYDVILGKLDNVDEAKRLRYQKVYDKLKDFEDYMVEKGVITELPQTPGAQRKTKPEAVKREMVLLGGSDVVDQLKFSAIEHNIKLMSRFHSDTEFASLIETARSEQELMNLRTYISIFGEYSTYMTEKQKLLTMKFLYELLAHKESDIRVQAAHIMGHMIATFSEEYKKEVPTDINLPDRLVNNLTLFDEYLEEIIHPNYKFTEQHKKWIGSILDTFAKTVVSHCKVSCRYNYFDILQKYYEDRELNARQIMMLLDAAMVLDPTVCTASFLKVLQEFLRHAYGRFNKDVDIAVVNASRIYFDDYSEAQYDSDLRSIMGISDETFDQNLASMFLDNLKTGTSWIQKVTNIAFMLRYVNGDNDHGKMLHVGTHLANLIKVSETVTVRRAAGEGLLSIIEKMAEEQRNEITVELVNGLELGDYQFSKYVPDYLGIIMLYLSPAVMEESIDELEKIMGSDNETAASSAINTLGVMLEHYPSYKGRFDEPEDAYEARHFRILNMLLKAYAGYNKVCEQEAFWTLGAHFFGSSVLSMEEKNKLFTRCHKKLMTLLLDKKEHELSFYNNAAVLNNLYRYICQHQAECGDFVFAEKKRAAFYPGTFDPFSLGHKAVATTIRDMGFEVYLALDEFSWSKKTQPRLQRRRIMTMSVADEEDIFIFPEDRPVNIANPADIKMLKDTFAGRELYIAVGSDVIRNASCYKVAPEEHSIHTVNHVVFARESNEQRAANPDEKRYPIEADVINLTLKKYYEDISSTRIRENIDLNRDISNLIDPIAQSYIYDRNLYLRAPAYKYVMQAREIHISSYEYRSADCLEPVKEELAAKGYDFANVEAYLRNPKVRTLYTETGVRQKKMASFAAAHRVETGQLLQEFGDAEIASYIRKQAAGSVAVIGMLFAGKGRTISGMHQITLTEILTELIARDFTYAVYHPADPAGMDAKIIDVLQKHGFVNIAGEGKEPVYAVDMKSPIMLFRDVETVIKNPLNKNPEVQKAIGEAHDKLVGVLTDIYKGQIILSFHVNVVHNKIINKVAQINGVSTEPDKNNVRGPYMSVPFGKALADVVVPNTVTKALHTEKYYDARIASFDIAESKHYSALDNQAKTLKSFNRPVILIDDLLHKGHRMNIVDPILKENQVEVKQLVVGVMSGNGRDLMAVKNREVESAYFLPNLEFWLNERDCYPFIGGDSIDKEDNAGINLVLPYTTPVFINKNGMESAYAYSMACLENARDILQVLEKEYQATFEKKLTLKRLGEVISNPRIPDNGMGVEYDETLAPSVFVENAIEQLYRLKRI